MPAPTPPGLNFEDLAMLFELASAAPLERASMSRRVGPMLDRIEAMLLAAQKAAESRPEAKTPDAGKQEQAAPAAATAG